MLERKIFAALVAIAFIYIASPLIFAIAMGGVLAVLFSPWLERLEKKKIPTAAGSAILTIGITVILILPTSLLVFFIAKTGIQQLQALKSAPNAADNGLVDSLFNSPRVHELMVWVTSRAPVKMSDLSNSFQDLASSLGTRLTDILGGLLGQLPGMTMGMVVVVVSIYFFLVDGRRLVSYCRRNTVFTEEQTEQLLSTIAGTCRSVILASLVSGAAQAFLESFACILTGTPNVLLIGLIVFIASFVPVVGSTPVTFAVAIHQLMEGQQGAGIALLITSLIIIGVDNAIRPWFLRGTANLHPLIAFIAAFGGLQTIGFLGVFLGPIIAALFVVTAQILTQAESKIEKILS